MPKPDTDTQPQTFDAVDKFDTAEQDTGLEVPLETGPDLPPEADVGQNLPPEPDSAPDILQPHSDTTPYNPLDVGSDVDSTLDEEDLIVKPSTSSKTSDDSGCQAGLNSTSSGPEAATLAFSAMALLAIRRRREKKSQ